MVLHSLGYSLHWLRWIPGYVVEKLYVIHLEYCFINSFNMEPTSDPFLARLQLFLDPDEKLLICGRSDCGYALAVERSQVTSHLRDKHRVDQ